MSTLSPALRRAESIRLVQTVKCTSGQRGGIHQCNAGGNGQQAIDARHRIFGVAAAAEQRADGIARLPAGDAAAKFRDGAGDFHAQRAGRAGRRRIHAHGLGNIGAVESCRGDGDQNLAGAGRGPGDIRHLQGIGGAGVVDPDGAHRRAHDGVHGGHSLHCGGGPGEISKRSAQKASSHGHRSRRPAEEKARARSCWARTSTPGRHMNWTRVSPAWRPRSRAAARPSPRAAPPRRRPTPSSKRHDASTALRRVNLNLEQCTAKMNESVARMPPRRWFTRAPRGRCDRGSRMRS